MATTDQQVLSWLQRRVTEPDDAGATWPSGLWTQAEVLGYMNQRQQAFMTATGVDAGEALIPYLSGVKDYLLPQDLVQAFAVTWIAADGTTHPLDPSTSFQLDLYDAAMDVHVVQRPWAFLQQTDCPIGQIRVSPPANASGTLRVWYLPVGDTVDGSGQILVIPDEFVPAYRWGVLEDMLRKAGRGQNLLIAEYARARWEMGVIVAKGIVEGYF